MFTSLIMRKPKKYNPNLENLEARQLLSGAKPTFNVHAISQSQVEVDWLPVKHSTGYLVQEAITQYKTVKVHGHKVTKPVTAWATLAKVGPGSISYIVNGLTPSTTYTIDLTSLKGRVKSQGSAKSVVTFAVPPIPTPPPGFGLVGTPTTMENAVVSFAKSHLGQKVGSGECAALASEALRVAGAEYQQGGPDYSWGSLVTTITPGHDSNPSSVCQPGDILQYQNTLFSSGWSASQHTAIVATVDGAGRPTAVYEQNVGDGTGAYDRFVRLDNITVNSGTLIAGTVHVYRPDPRHDTPGVIRFTIVNNTMSPVTVTQYFNGHAVGTLQLDVYNTLNSYEMGSGNSTGAGTWSLGVGSSTVNIANAGGYEVYGPGAIRAV